MSNMVNKGDFFRSLSEEQKEAGYMKFNIPDEDHPDNEYGEGVWGWMTPEEKKIYDDDHFFGKVKAILCNTPLNYFGRLVWGTEVVLQCHGASRPTLDPEWVKEHLS